MFKQLFLLFIFFSLSSLAQTHYREISYTSTGSPFVICDETGIQELINMRTRQWEKNKKFLGGPKNVPKEGCIVKYTKVAFKNISTEYALSFIDESVVLDSDGNDPCPWNPEQRCRNYEGPPAVYVEASYFSDISETWRGDVFVEMNGDFELMDLPEHMQTEKDRDLDSLSQNTHQGEFLTALTKELNKALEKANKGVERGRGLSMLQTTEQEKIPTVKDNLHNEEKRKLATEAK